MLCVLYFLKGSIVYAFQCKFLKIVFPWSINQVRRNVKRKMLCSLQVAFDVFYTEGPQKQESHCTEAYIKPSPSYYGDDIFYDYSTLSKPVHIGTLLLTRLQTLFSFYHILTGVYLCAFPF